MVDYDIIRILKSYVGYSSWTDVPTKKRELCYKNYNQNMTLPEWNIEQVRYWQVSTVNSVLEYIVYSFAFVEENFQDIPSFKRREWFDVRVSWRNISRYSFLENFVLFRLWEEYDLMQCLLLYVIF